ncbi:MAG: apolipoprotein N-acyltransferase [Bdellovibrionales bacterium]|nr:apolipoprotein N-acyltransferase [Bdellovibrionales bacterium]
MIAKYALALWKNWGPTRATLLSAFLIVVAFPPWNLAFLIWIAPIPWILEQRAAKSWREALQSGLWLSWLMTCGGFGWATYALKQFGGIPLPLAALLFALGAVIGQPQFVLFPALVRLWRAAWGKGAMAWPAAPTAALLYTAADRLAPKLFLDTLGHSQYATGPTRQLAELSSAFVITGLLWWVAEAWAAPIASQWAKVRKEARAKLNRAQWLHAGMAAAALLVAVTWGIWRQRDVLEAMNASPHRLRLTAVQANIGDFEKLASESGLFQAGTDVVNKYFALSDRAIQSEHKPHAVIWPETAYPSTFRTPLNSFEAARDRRVEQYVRERQVPLWFGGYDHEGTKDFNSLFFLRPVPDAEGKDLRVYHKSILLPFGEYIPFTEDVAWVRDTFPQVGYFGRGPGASVFRHQMHDGLEVAVTPVICYEALFTSFGVEAARKGTQLLLNITNDSWFGPFGEPHLHLALTTFRGIETRLPQFRATNTGISTLILPDGQITGATPLFEEALLESTIALPPPGGFRPTLAVAWGDWFGWFSAIVSALGLALGAGLRRRRHS